MFRLIYHSVSDVECSPLILTDILEVARQNNAALGVTGLLACHDGQFMQVLEGERADVEHIMGKIERDARHHSIVVLTAERVSERAFGDWAMAHADEGSIAAERLARAVQDAAADAGHPVVHRFTRWLTSGGVTH